MKHSEKADVKSFAWVKSTFRVHLIYLLFRPSTV